MVAMAVFFVGEILAFVGERRTATMEAVSVMDVSTARLFEKPISRDFVRDGRWTRLILFRYPNLSISELLCWPMSAQKLQRASTYFSFLEKGD